MLDCTAISSSGDLPHLVIKHASLASPALASGFFITAPPTHKQKITQQAKVGGKKFPKENKIFHKCIKRYTFLSSNQFSSVQLLSRV